MSPKKHLNQKEHKLRQCVAQILWQDWDPIGLYNPQGDQCDEYASYVDPIFSLLIRGCDATKMANYLTHLVNSQMGLSTMIGNYNDCRVANLLVTARLDIINK